MGFLKRLFGSARDPEADGDAALARGDDLDAARQFRAALRALPAAETAARARVTAKLADARGRFLAAKLAEVERWLDDDVLEAAAEGLAIAREHVTAEDAAARDRIESLAARLRAAETEPAPPPPAGPTDREAAADLAPPAAAPAALPADADTESLFEQLAGVLAPADRARAAELDPAFRAGFVAQQGGDLAAAVEQFDRARQAHPNEPLVWEHWGAVLDLVDRDREAADAYRTALDQDPQRAQARLGLASILGGLSAEGTRAARPAPDETHAALRLLQEGLEQDRPRGLLYLATAIDVLMAAGRSAEAAEQSEQLLAAGGERMPDAWAQYARVLEAQERLDEARAAHEKAVQLSGQAMAPRAEFAEFALRHKLGLEKAQELIFDTCLGCQASRPDEQTLAYYGFLLTRIQFARSDYQGAIEGAQRLLAQEPPAGVAAEMRALIAAARDALSGGTE